MKILNRIFGFYYQGFKSMTIGKPLWVLILIKLFIIFAILKLFFFKDFLKTNFNSDKERSEFVLKNLTDRK